ncbi:Nn.00g068880.m01.CDS01 [Neocucurbitaria sp. VM-36]
MSSLRLATASNVRAFQSLSTALSTSDNRWAQSIDREALEDEIGRFRVWCGNLGALLKGHGSLDYRLRDSPLLSSNALKFLGELEENLNEAFAVVSGARLPYEEQPKPEKTDDDDNNDDNGFFSEDDDDDDEEDESSSTRLELSMRFSEVVDIIDNLYKLSVRIRTPTIRSRSLKAASYKPKDPETGVDLLSTYATYDMQHIKELLSHIRQPHLASEKNEEDFLVARLSAAVTLRRRQFKYWKRHREKLGASTMLEVTTKSDQPMPLRPEVPQCYDQIEVQAEVPINVTVVEAPSQKTGKTLLSATEATQHHQSLDEIVDARSMTSFAVTVKDIHGKGIDLPPPPRAANGEKDFECPYCYIICPARYGRGRAWRTHLLQDLQPYICTYPECESSEQLFRSRREWVEHEASHRKAWRCPEHPTAIYKTPAGFEDHLRREHMENGFPESQVTTIVKVGETSTLDVRQKCPICYAPADAEGLENLQNHIANHLERIATFSLPNAVDDDSDGASSVASRGWTGSQDVSEMSLPSDTTEGQEEPKREPNTVQDARAAELAPNAESSRAFLSAESLQKLPDASQNRLDLTVSHFKEQSSLEDTQIDDEDSDTQHFEDELVDETSAEVQEHLEQREAFRIYLMSLMGSELVRFYKRYGSWTGQVTFKDDAAAAKAVEMFDAKRFPFVRVHQSLRNKNKVKFAASNLPKPKGKNLLPSRQSTVDTQDNEDARSSSSVSIIYDGEENSRKRPVLTVSDIPTLRSLYRSRRLEQRDQSYAPNDVYNRTISFCYYDLTRLKVDAIVNSANSAMKITKSPETLNYAIHKAGGPGLTKEARSKGKVKAGQVELTHGHGLPSAWVIHASRPRYSGSKGMGQFNVLTECYRSALKMALNYEFKEIAFPCLGTGGCGFTPRVAARIALQEVREFLDAHANNSLERIVFCVNSALDEKAYMDFFPVFFPPTHGDLEVARSSGWSANRAALAAQVLETRSQVQRLFEELSTDFSLVVPDFNTNILGELSAIDSALASIRDFLLGPKELKRSLGDLNLMCSVMQTVCGSVTEITELAKDTAGAAPKHKAIWDDYNEHFKTTHATDLTHFLVDCQNFVQCLADIVTLNGIELDEMPGMRQRLESFKAKQVGQDTEGIRDHLDEVLYIRESQRENVSHTRELVKVHQIPSVSQLYQVGELEAKPTLAHPSAIFNHTIGLAREDITKLEVDMIVNSTDVSFHGMGILDRTVFKKGGSELREQVKRFGKCREGDVRVTPGYLLPAKHILHVIPPQQYRKNTKDILRQIYREVLHTAILMRATSIAIPSIGTGMLSYPRRDCASLAMEEVKRFLETAEPSNLLEKIIFVVYSSNDEFIYKSLLPVYFPPKEYGTQALPAMQPTISKDHSSPADPSPTPRRTLFGSMSEALRSVRFGKQPETSRQVNTYEEHALIGFESHAKDCTICRNIDKLYLEGDHLCEEGYPLAQLLLWYMNMSADQNVYTKPDNTGQRTRLDVPADMFPISLCLLTTVEKSLRDDSRNEPFVNPNQTYHRATFQSQVYEGGAPPAVTTRENDRSKSLSISASSGQQYLRAEVATWSNLANRWDPIFPEDCSIQVYPGRVDIRESSHHAANHVPLLALQLTSTTVVSRYATNTEVIISGASRLKSVITIKGDVLLRTQSAIESEALFNLLQRGIGGASEDPARIEHEKELEPLAELFDAGSLSGESSKPTDSYPELNQRLHDIQKELASAQELGEGRSSPLQYKIRSLREELDKLQLSSSPGSRTSALDQPVERDPSAPVQRLSDDGNHNPLVAQVLAHLTTDLKSRPGSYIGQHTKDIASALQKDQSEVSTAIRELAAQGKVHNTVDESTWVISRPLPELPVLLQQQKVSDNRNISTADESQQLVDILAAQVLSYMKYVNYAPGNGDGQTVRELASALQLPSSDLWPAIRQLAARGDIQRSSNAETWVITATPRDVSYEMPDPARNMEKEMPETSEPRVKAAEIRNTTTFKDTPPSPTTPTTSSSFQPTAGPSSSYIDIDLDLSTINLDDYFTHPSASGARWTRIDKRLVSAQVLIDAEEDFEDTGDSLVVHRVLRRGEIKWWAEKTRDIRLRQESTSGVEKPKFDPTVRSQRKDGGERVRSRGSREIREDKEGWRDGRGEKDRRQAKLDRVLAGDMKEEELRHFAETEDDWRSR